jgi:hypothetical protein
MGSDAERIGATQAFVNVSGAACSCAETARLLFPLKPAVKGGLPCASNAIGALSLATALSTRRRALAKLGTPSATNKATILQRSIECPSHE